MAAAHDVQSLLAQLGSRIHTAAQVSEEERPLNLEWSGLEELLPDGGFPRGVVELAAPRALGGGTTMALTAVRAGQARAKSAWCAWIDPEESLHAPGVAALGVDLSRMLVVRAPRLELARTALQVVASGAFEVVVVDVDAAGATPKNFRRGEAFARKLALAAEPSGATVVLLTDSAQPRSCPWPVSLRLELRRPDARSLWVRVAKDRRARVGLARAVPFPSDRRLVV